MNETKYEVMRIDCLNPLGDGIDWEETPTGELYLDKQIAEKHAEELKGKFSEGFDVGDGGVTTPQFYVRVIGSAVVDQYEY
jgi:hypothetical protein